MLCAGVGRREGWKTLDAVSTHGPDYLATIPPLPEVVLAEKWDEIEWVHGITSLYPWDAEEVLKQCQTILVPGGKLTLEQPNSRIAAQMLLDESEPKWVFGDPKHKNPFIMNRWCYTPETLYLLLSLCGFRHIQLLPAKHHLASRDFRMEAFA